MALSRLLPASFEQPNPVNYVINSDMEVSQRGTSFTTASGYGDYTLDRWMSGHTVTGKFSIAQVTDAPTGFKHSLKATSASAYSVGTNEEFVIRQKIEGQNCIALALGTSSAKTVTLSFWVKSSLTGTFSGAFLNSAENRCYVFTYDISSASTWEKKEISVALDTSGTWLTTNGIGLTLYFSLGAGSGLQASAGSWISTKDLTTSSSVNLVGTNAATWQITGVVLNEGSKAETFKETYAETLEKCQRYYTRFQATSAYSYFGSGVSSDTSTARIFKSFPVEMNHIPVLEQSANNTWNIYPPGAGFTADATINNASTWGSAINCTTGATQTDKGGSHCTANNTTNAYFAFESEL
tara:strand:+ start:2763 stop:3821 length:1059 start_codon:yes stop_codon:yes gene_type:complete